MQWMKKTERQVGYIEHCKIDGDTNRASQIKDAFRM